MNHHHYFNRIELSSLKPKYNDEQPSRQEQDSIINELDYFRTDEDDESPIVKIQSFVYTQQLKNSLLEQSRRDNQQLQVYSSLKYDRCSEYRIQQSLFQSKQYRNDRKSKIESNILPNSVRSIKEQLMEQNKLLQEKLKSNKHTHHRVYQPYNIATQYFRVKSNQQYKIDTQSKPQAKITNPLNEHIPKLQQQYTSSNTIKYYNFIMKELPRCQKCHGIQSHAVKKQKNIKLECIKCQDSNTQVFHPFIGILYDLQTKIRFEEDLQLSQTILQGFNKQIEALKKEIEKIENIKDKLTQIKSASRKKYKQLNQVKYFIKKNLSKLNAQHILQLQTKISNQYLQQVERWKQIDQLYEDKWKYIYSSIYRMMPIYLHDHTDSKILSGLYKILNYQKNQQVKISVSQHINFPIKQMDSVVFMVDGSYNLPIFENIKHLQMQFQQKKTERQLNLLFSNLPRQIYSLGFRFNHKMHSHISAQNFPFLKYIAPVQSIKKLNLKIENVKDYGDVLRLPQFITEKIQFRLKITKHLFIREQLNLPYSFYEKMFDKLGSNLVIFQLTTPQAIDSIANVSYQKIIHKNKLCYFLLERGQKSQSRAKNQRVLDGLNEQVNMITKKKESIVKKVIYQRNKLVKLYKAMISQKIQQKQLVISSVTCLL